MRQSLPEIPGVLTTFLLLRKLIADHVDEIVDREHLSRPIRCDCASDYGVFYEVQEEVSSVCVGSGRVLCLFHVDLRVDDIVVAFKCVVY